MIYITGDTHGNFTRAARFCERMETTKEDILIVLGDAGINYYGDSRDRKLKRGLSALPITFFCIHGNHEMRPTSVGTYQETIWNGGTVYIEPEYPDLLFAKDGELFDLDGQKAIALGGAYSVDKDYRLARGFGWWPDEQPSDEIKSHSEEMLNSVNWKVDVVLSHTTPLRYEPVEVFLSCIDQSKVDKSTEEWLDSIERRLEYNRWYCGHYHTRKRIDKLQFMFEDIDAF